MFAIFLLVLDRLGLLLIPPPLLGLELFIGLGLAKEFLPPPDSFPSSLLEFVGEYAGVPSHGLLLLIVQACAYGRTFCTFCTGLAVRSTRFFLPQCRWALLLPP